jgi:hypothetical protein
MKMDKQTKILFGKILGEIYRIQRRMESNACPVGESTVYGLLNGFEHVIDEEIERIGFISREEFKNMCNILDEYYFNEEKLKDFKGYYDIEHKLSKVSIDRPTAIKILRYLKANGSYLELIEKMNSEYSPVECRKFDLNEWDL